MSVTTRNQEVLIAAPRAMVVRAAVAIIVVAGAKTIWGFYLGSRRSHGCYLRHPHEQEATAREKEVSRGKALAERLRRHVANEIIARIEENFASAPSFIVPPT
jgi:hypothetical protein